MLFTLSSVEYALKFSKLHRHGINPIDAFMFLIENFSYETAVRMPFLQMVKYFKENKENLLKLYDSEEKATRKIA